MYVQIPPTAEAGSPSSGEAENGSEAGFGPTPRRSHLTTVAKIRRWGLVQGPQFRSLCHDQRDYQMTTLRHGSSGR